MRASAIHDHRVNVCGSDIPVTRAGERGQTVILIHGAGGDRRDWDRTIPALSTRCRVYSPDLIGFGESPRDNVTYTIAMFRDFIISLMDELRIQDTVLIGHSLGGRISLEVAAAIPERVSRLVLAAPLGFGPLSPIGRIISTSAWAIHKAAHLTPPFPDMALNLNDHECAAFQNVRQPTLLVWGSRDIYFPKSHGWRALRTLPNARLKIYKGAGHSPHAAYPEHFTSDVHHFLSQKLTLNPAGLRKQSC